MEKNKTGENLIIFGSVVAVLLLIIFIVVSFFNGYGPHNFTTTTTTEATTTETTTETTTMAFLSAGDSGIVSKSQVVLNRIECAKELHDDSGYYKITADDNCKYILVYITIKNIGKEATSFRWINNDFYCQLNTSDGLEYSPSSFFPYVGDSLENMSLNPLEERKGFVGFSVPDEVINSGRELYFVCDGYPDEVRFKIR